MPKGEELNECMNKKFKECSTKKGWVGVKFSEREEEEGAEEKLKTLEEYMKDIALLTDAEDPDKREDGDYVSLMTIHAAKGLEFPHVYVVGVEENLFPSSQSLSSRSYLEEERRLFYVAVTRAMKRITISFAETRYKWGNLNFCEPSRFLEEINPSFIEFPRRKSQAVQKDFIFDTKPVSKPALKNTLPPNFVKKNLVPFNKAAEKPSAGEFQPTENVIDLLQVGMKVQHERFGTGKVINVEGKAAEKKAMVFFEGVGQKQLLLKFAKLRILE